MSIRASVLALERLSATSPAWSLFRKEIAPIAIAVLGDHLAGDERRLTTPELFERIDADLDELRDHGYEGLRTARAYCADWRSSGILIQRPTEVTRVETAELSPEALSAIQYVRALSDPSPTLTQSRLATIESQLAALARDTDPRVETRLESLRGERQRLDDQIAQLESGGDAVVDERLSTERAVDIVEMARRLPDDFARVRSDLEAINRDLRRRVTDDTGGDGHVLDEIFLGVDLLAESDAGRSFSGFYSLLLDPELGDRFEASIEQILTRPFAGDLTPAQRQFLRRLLRTLHDRSAEVHAVMTTFARGLRRFVQSQEYQQDRVIRRRLREALNEAVDLATALKPYDKIDFELALTGVPIRSIGALTMHNPADLEAPPAVTARDEQPVDLEALRLIARETEIDEAELRENVNDVVDERGDSTIGDVLGRRPATQGIASVIGLVALADRHARRMTTTETVTWETRQQTGRPDSSTTTMSARIPVFVFSERIT